MNIVGRIGSKIRRVIAGRLGSAAYWSVYSVAERTFASREESVEHFSWRSDQYVNYLNLMPVSGLDGKVVLDFGCGPGNDLVGFLEFSRPQRLYAADVSERSIEMASNRIKWHPGQVEFIKLSERQPEISLPSESVDYIHTSGVLHHVHDLESTVKDLSRVLKKGGQLRVMVYNYDSIWLHLNAAYLERLKLADFGRALSLFDIFRATTDGKDCPIARVYRPSEFVCEMEKYGFSGRYLGAAISMHEMKILGARYDAILDTRLEKAHRDFLLELEFDKKGVPMYRGNIAGIDACFTFTKH